MNVKLKKGFIIREVADEQVLLPAGMESVDFSNMIVLNETAAVVVEQLLQGQYLSIDALVQAVTDSFDVESEEARKDIEELLDSLEALHLLETE